MTTDTLDILLDHHRWSTHRVLEACVPLSQDQWHKTFAMGVGSLHHTMLHVVRCVQGWTNRVQQIEWPRHAEAHYTRVELMQMNDASVNALARLISRYRQQGTLDEVAEETFHPADREPVHVRFTRRAAIVHCLVHGTHHRAQALNMLRQLGVAPSPEIDVMDWHHEEDFKS